MSSPDFNTRLLLLLLSSLSINKKSFRISFFAISETGPTKYILVNRTMNFSGARTYCRSLYSGLASIRNQTEKEIIAGLVTKRTWIGLNRKRYSQWSNALPVKFSNWNKSQPDIPESMKRRCSLVSASTGKWFEEWCSKTHHFVCEKVTRVHRLKLKLKFRSGADMNDPAVIRHITEQVLHVLMKSYTVSISTCVSFLLVFTLTHQPSCPQPKKTYNNIDSPTSSVGTSCKYRVH